jgi:hypothetical protein
VIEIVTQIAKALATMTSVAARIVQPKSRLRLIATPNLELPMTYEDHSFRVLFSFRLIIRNEGKKSAEDVRLWLRVPQKSGIEIKPKEKHVEITDGDSVNKGIWVKYPGWKGPEQFWRVRQGLVHPNEELRVADVLIHPDWPGWNEQPWTFIEWSICARDSKEFSGKIWIPIGGAASEIW